nr:hypothetical protein [Tanacetum cinerariifolium]
MRTRSQSRENFPQQEASPAIVEPLRIKIPFLEDQFQEDPPKDPPESKSKVRQTQAKAVVAKVSTSSSTPAISFDVAELKDMVRSLLLDKKNQSSAPSSSFTPAPVKAVEPNCVTCSGPTIPTPSKQETEVTEDQVQTPSSQSTAPIQPLVAQSETQTPVFEPVVAPVSASMPNLKPSIPYPSRRDNERRHD